MTLSRFAARLAVPFALLTGLALFASLANASAQPAAELPRPIDLFLLVDDSNCMASGTLNDMPSRDAIAAGIAAVLEQLDPERDRVALIGFGDTAESFSPLTKDWDQLQTDFDKLTQRDGSARLDLAYHKVATMLNAGGAREGALVATLVVTDGPMMQAPALARPRAQQLRNEFGVRHYSIAVGTIAQYAMLRGISEPNGFWVVSFGGDLISAYQEAGAAIVALSNLDPAEIPTLEPTATTEPLSARGYLPSLLRH